MDWPKVEFGGSHEPYIDRMSDDSAVVRRSKTAVSYGTVEGYPWSLVVYCTTHDDRGSAARECRAGCEFFLGGSSGFPHQQPGGLGGGGGPVRLLPGRHITTIAHCWDSSPQIIGYAIFVSDQVRALLVRPERARERTVEPRSTLPGVPRVCVFFPPFAVPGAIFALDEVDKVLQRRQLYSGALVRRGTFGGGDG